MVIETYEAFTCQLTTEPLADIVASFGSSSVACPEIETGTHARTKRTLIIVSNDLKFFIETPSVKSGNWLRLVDKGYKKQLRCEEKGQGTARTGETLYPAH